jgi:hypothetical protein
LRASTIFIGAVGIADPLRVEVVGAGGHALVTFTRVDLARVAAMEQLEQMVLAMAMVPVSECRMPTFTRPQHRSSSGMSFG